MDPSTNQTIPLHALVSFRDPVGGAILSGKIVGRSFEPSPHYDVRVGTAVHNNVAAECIVKVGTIVVPLPRRLP